jgi:hypothetical protein
MRYAFLVIVMAVTAFPGAGYAQGNSQQPPDEAIAFAQRTSDLLLATLFAALTQEFDETTADNVEEGKVSIGLVFSDAHTNFRLVGTTGPFSENSRPQDDFERTALGQALAGGQPVTDVQRVQGAWFYRRSIPLSVFRAECALCHSNYAGLGENDWVGALMLKVPIRED